MVTKDNEVKREKHLQSAMMSNMQKEQQRQSDLRSQLDSLRNTNSSLHHDIKTQQDVINEQKVSRVQACSYQSSHLTSPDLT